MRRLLRRLRRQPNQVPRRPNHAAGRAPTTAPGNAGNHYRSAYRRPLNHREVRQRHFAAARRGLDPAEVEDFLHRVADELATLSAELAWTRDENARIKGALRDWQSRFAPRVWRRT